MLTFLSNQVAPRSALLGLVLAALVIAPARADDKPASRGQTPTLKTYPVEAGHSIEIAEALQTEFAGNRSVRIEPVGSRSVMVLATPKVHAAIQKIIGGQNQPKGISGANKPDYDIKKLDGKKPVYELTLPANGPFAKANGSEPTSQLVDPQDDKGPPAKQEGDAPKKKGAPITIATVGNKIIIRSEDPEALAATARIIRLLTETPEGEGDFTVIRLKYAPATEAAQVLNEIFNGPQQRQNNGRSQFGGFAALLGGGGRGGRGGGRTPQEPQKPPRVQIVAEPNSNSLLVKASQLDLFEIKRLLDTAIDSGTTDSEAVVRTYVLEPLKYANATDVATVVETVYREQMNENPRGGANSRSSRSRGGFQNANVDAYGNPRPVQLSIGVDERTNTLVLATTEKLHKDISKLAKDMDESAKNTERVVRLIPTPGVDPSVIQQAAEAIQGIQTSTNSTNRFSPFGGGTSRFGGGGGSPFGGGGTSRFGGGGGGTSRFGGGGGTSRFGGGGTSRFGGGGTSRFGGGGGTRGGGGRR